MFIGHFSTAMIAAAHPKAPKLGTLFVASQLVDFGFFTLLMVGGENMRITPGLTAMNGMDLYDMPWTHSLLGAVGWGLAFAALIWLWRRDMTTALIAGAVVVSHWFLDLLVHAPDLTLAGSPPKFGLGLWNHPLIEMPLELALTFGALAFYASRTRVSRPSLAMPALVVFLFVVQLFNWFGPQPNVVDLSVSVSALAGYTIAALLAAWVAKGRTVIGATADPSTP